MTSPQALRLSIGPVQGFIAAGRRTRDFWAGSFLLSRLAGEAMAAVIEQNGVVTIPAVYDADEAVIEPTLKAIMTASQPTGPIVGTLPNHFRAEVPDAFDVKAVKAVEAAVRAKFSCIAQAVWDHFFANAGFGADVKTRWDFQTSGDFFEILWVMGDAVETEDGWQDESRWLDQRKTMRDHPPLLEADAGLPGTGDRCPVHPDLCELGGFFRVHQRDKQDKFWEKLRKQVVEEVYGSGASRFIETLEIREGERLSALALVKRLFPLLPPDKIKAVMGWVPDHRYDGKGTASTAEEAQYALRNWPSTAYVSAVPWIVEVGRQAPRRANRYALKQHAILKSRKLWESETPQFHRMKGINDILTVAPSFAVLDGTLHFERGLEKSRVGMSGDTPAQIQKKQKQLVRAFRQLQSQIPDSLRGEKPSPFYALLDMDGDNMGPIFSHSQARAKAGSTALLEFAAGVPEIVREHDGVLIYAGADDVNAMLPVETAIHCAMAIRKHWTKVMAAGKFDACVNPRPTLSGSIVFSDYQNHLGEIRALSHDRLDRVAKDGMGRDALAIAVAKSGGVASEWASAWDGGGDIDSFAAVNALFDYAKAAGTSPTIASRLAYLVRDRFSEILDDPAMFDNDALIQLLTKEMGDSGLSGLGDTNVAKAARIVAVLQPYCRKGVPAAIEPAPRHVGGLLVARFLAQKAMWPYFENWIKPPAGATP